MPGVGWIAAIAALVLLAFIVGAVAGSRLRAIRRRSAFARACQNFRHQREHLEAKFFHLAANSGKPRGLRWSSCDFDDVVAFARDRKTGDLIAFVGVAIGFEAIEGGGMEDVEAVGNIRAATAVFQFNETWRTDGRVIFNLNPTEAIDHFHNTLEMVAENRAAR